MELQPVVNARVSPKRTRDAMEAPSDTEKVSLLGDDSGDSKRARHREPPSLPQRPYKPMSAFSTFKRSVDTMMVVEGEGTSRPDSAAKAKELWEQLPQRAALEEKFERRMRAYRQRMSEYEKDLAAHAKWHQEDAIAQLAQAVAANDIAKLERTCTDIRESMKKKNWSKHLSDSDRSKLQDVLAAAEKSVQSFRGENVLREAVAKCQQEQVANDHDTTRGELCKLLMQGDSEYVTEHVQDYLKLQNELAQLKTQQAQLIASRAALALEVAETKEKQRKQVLAAIAHSIKAQMIYRPEMKNKSVSLSVTVPHVSQDLFKSLFVTLTSRTASIQEPATCLGVANGFFKKQLRYGARLELELPLSARIDGKNSLKVSGKYCMVKFASY